MAEVTITPAAVSEYKNDKLQNVVETARLGYQGGDFPGYHDIMIELELPRGLKSLTVFQGWKGRNPANVYPTYGVWLTKEVLTAPPGTAEADTADTTFKFSSNNDATVTINKRLSSGKWYLWFGRIRKSGEAASFMSGDRGKHPILTITGETAGGVVRVAVDGEVKDAVPKVYKNGGWEDIMPRVYKNGTWEEMS